MISPLFLAALSLHAVRTPLADTGETPSVFPKQLDLSVPASAATDILGVSASNVKQGANLHDLTGSLINSFDKSGHLKQGFALNSSLKKLGIGGVATTSNYHRYYNDIGYRIHWGSNVSLAAIKGSSTDDPSARVALAFSIPLMDHTDWRANDDDINAYRDLVVAQWSGVERPEVVPDKLKATQVDWETRRAECAALLLGPWLERNDDEKGKTAESKKALQAVIETINAYVVALVAHKPETDVTPLRDAAYAALVHVNNQDDDENPDHPGIWDTISQVHRKTAVSDLIDDFVKKRNEANWNKRKFDVSLATTWFAADAATDGLKSDGTYAWANYSDALGQDGKITLYGKYATKDRSFDAKAKLWNVGNARAFGASYRHKSGAFLEYMSSTIDAPSGKKTDIIWQGGWEFKVNGDQWVQVAMGKGSGSGVSRNILGINWTFNLSPTSTLKAK